MTEGNSQIAVSRFLNIILLILSIYSYWRNIDQKDNYENRIAQYRERDAQYQKELAEYERQMADYKIQADKYQENLAAWEKSMTLSTNRVPQSVPQ